MKAMFPNFVILLAVALASLWVFWQAAEHRHVPVVLAGLTGAICFIWGFAITPWPVQIAIVLALVGLDRIYHFRRAIREQRTS
jgi:DMSO/TMAO reductase YedYZ heme-binding membrane subunit